MSIITKPSSIVKGTGATITLNKVDLVAKATEAGADSYFQDPLNWSQVIIQYKSSTGSQKEVLSFNATLATPTATFLVSARAKDVFQVNSITLVDFDGGSFHIPRSQLTVADFDIDMTAAPSTSYTFSNALKSSDITLSNGNLTATRTSTSGGYCSALIDNAFMLSGSQKIYLELNVDRITNTGVEAIGIDFQTGTPSVFNDGGVTIPGFYGFQSPRIVWQHTALYKHPVGSNAGYIGTIGPMITGQIIGIAVDIQAQTFSFNNNGTWSSTFTFSDMIGVADRFYFAVGPYTHTSGSEDSFTKNISSTHTPFGYTLI